jgi:DNA (cytosine-5)-methyltransferase 1
VTFGSLFAGIGGLDLGLERAGMRCLWQVEIDPFCRKVLAKHWPTVPRFDDVTQVDKYNLPPVDLICGGFPCQDISLAGKGAGIDGERSGLWREMYRIICDVRPRYVLVENVSALTSRGLDRVLGNLAEGGFDAEWDCIPAAAVGAPHRRDRVFVVAHSDYARLEIWQDPTGLREFSATVGAGQWATEPDVGRVANGVPSRVDRLRALGGAVVPQVAEYIGRRIMEVGHIRLNQAELAERGQG